MRKKLGFTLAEILITMGIIGVVAALTTPVLINNTGKAEVGPKLAKFQSTMEAGLLDMLRDKHKTRISNIANITQAHVQGDIAPIQTYDLLSMLTEYVFMTVNRSSLDFVMKDGSTVGELFLSPTDGAAPYKGIVGGLKYDINGSSGNNTVCKEVFGFAIDDSGQVIPIGSNAYQHIVDSTGINPSQSLADDYSCTGRIADNNWVAE